jgi:hypothetical protein
VSGRAVGVVRRWKKDAVEWGIWDLCEMDVKARQGRKRSEPVSSPSGRGGGIVLYKFGENLWFIVKLIWLDF